MFLDAIGAGYSRPLGDTKGTEFWGVDQDIDAFARGIQRYMTINHRWNSPKFIFGESYGTTRSAGLSIALQQHGVQLNGVLLLSSILNYGPRDPGFDQSCQLCAELRGHRGLPQPAGAARRPTWRPSSPRCAPGRAAPTPWRSPRADDLSPAEKSDDRQPAGRLHRPLAATSS